jgi:hypothetical protein
MTSTELALFKDMIKGCVREVIKEELQHAYKKDLLEIKKLVAKSILESRQAPKAVQKAAPVTGRIIEGKRYDNKPRVEERYEQEEEGPSEDVMQSLYEMYGGIGEYKRMTGASTTFVEGSGGVKASDTIPTIAKNPLMNILEETRRGGISQDDIRAFKQGEQEIQYEAPAAPKYMPPMEDYEESPKNMSVPDFDFRDIAKKRFGK